MLAKENLSDIIFTVTFAQVSTGSKQFCFQILPNESL